MTPEKNAARGCSRDSATESEVYHECGGWDDTSLGCRTGEGRTYSGFSSYRTSLSPFTKDFRGKEHQ